MLSRRIAILCLVVLCAGGWFSGKTPQPGSWFSGKNPLSGGPGDRQKSSFDRCYLDFAGATVAEDAADPVVTIPAKLSKAMPVDVVATIEISGAKSQEEDYGLGKNFTWTGCANTAYETATKTVTFAAGDTTENISISVVNNPTVDLDRTISVRVTAATNIHADVTPRTVTITDAQRQHHIDVTNNSHLLALDASLDGKTLDKTGTTANTTNFNAITLAANNAGKKCVFYFPDGTYLFSENTYTYPNQTIIGESRAGVILRRYGTVAEIMARAGTFERVFLPVIGASATDSAPVAIKDVTLHGGDIPFSFIVTFTGNPSPGNTFKFVFRNAANEIIGGTGDTYTWVSGDPANNKEIHIEATAAANAAAMMACLELEANGYICELKTASDTIFTVTHPVYYKYGTSSAFVDSTAGMTWTTNEHCHVAGLGGDTTNIGKGVHRLENIYVTANRAAEPVTTYPNSDVSIYNYTDLAGGTEYFGRGILALGGGYCVNKIKNLVGEYLHAEQDVKGYYGAPGYTDIIAGTATSTSNDLYDTARDLNNSGFTVGMTVTNTRSGLSGPIATITGGSPNDHLTVTGVTWQSGDGYQVERGSAFFGSCHLYDITAVTAFYTCYTGDSVLYIKNNTITGVTNFYGPGNGTGGSVVIENSDFSYDGAYYAGATWRNVGRNAVVNRCKFRAGNNATGTSVGALSLNLLATVGLTDQKITFNDCEFYPGNGPATNKYGIYLNGCGDWELSRNEIIFNECLFATGLRSSMYHFSNYGGIFKFNNCVFDSYYAVSAAGGDDNQNYKIYIDGGTYNVTNFMSLPNCGSLFNYLYLDNIVMPAAMGGVYWQYTYQGQNLNVLHNTGSGPLRRLTYGATTPTSSNRGFRSQDGTTWDSWEKTDGTFYRPSGVNPMAWEQYTP